MQQPHLINLHNAYIGGVDRCDQNIKEIVFSSNYPLYRHACTKCVVTSSENWWNSRSIKLQRKNRDDCVVSEQKSVFL